MNTLAHFSAAELGAFAKALGWIQVDEAVVDGLYVFGHPDFHPQQLIFPINQDWDDYNDALLRAAIRLADIYNWQIADAFRRIEESNDDTVISRIPLNDTHVSTVSLLYASQVLEATKKLLASGAAANERRQPHYASTLFGSSQKLLEAARFRHTEVGSFIFKASANVYALDDVKTEISTQLSMFPETGDPPPTPFVRRAMVNIGLGVQDLLNSIRNGTEQQLIDGIISDGTSPVSSNFCKALADLRNREHPHAVDLSISWSPLLLPPPEAPSHLMRIKPADFPIIERIGQELQPEKDRIRDIFTGEVDELNGVFNELGQREGRVILSLVGERGMRVKVQLTLNPVQYEEAVAVHRTRTVLVRVIGTLIPKYRQPHDFDLEKFDILNV